MRFAFLLPLLVALPAAAHPFGAPVADAELAAMRGGIRLPDGTDVAIGVAIETQINGIVALRTQFSTLQSGVQVYTGGAPASGGTLITAGAMTTPIVDYERNAAGTLITVAPSTAAATVNVGGEALPPATGTPLALTPGGPAVATPFGSVALRAASGGFTTELAGAGFDVTQSVGQFTGAVVRNTADNQAITTSTWISINLTGVPVPSNLASTLAAAARAVAVH